MKKYFISFLVFAVLGCASVEVKAPKEPIKVDIAMRVDIYQHVVKDINEIENLVSGSEANKEQQSFWDIGMMDAYAQDLISSEAEAAALRRKTRRSQMNTWQSRGMIGENVKGLVEIRESSTLSEEVKRMVNEENADRIIIYKEISRKNGARIEDVQKLYSQRIYNDAPAGTPIQIEDRSGSFTWKNK